MHLEKDKRPKIETLSKSKTPLPIEEFQNQTLRPILKMKNEVLLAFFKNYIQNKKINWADKSKENKEAFIFETLPKDQNFKISIVHLILGNLCPEEYNQYLENAKEYKKRIWKMLQQRISSQVI